MSEFIQARTSDLETRAVDGQLVLLDLRTQTYLSLNRTGAELWPQLRQGAPRDDLVASLQTVPAGARRAARDVDALIGQLAQAGLLESGSAGAADA